VFDQNFDRVVGVDQSQAFIDAARNMALARSNMYRRPDRGWRATDLCALLDPAARPERVADACALPPGLVGFDAVLLASAPPSRLRDPHARCDQYSA
jgi:hypothetical protein